MNRKRNLFTTHREKKKYRYIYIHLTYFAYTKFVLRAVTDDFSKLYHDICMYTHAYTLYICMQCAMERYREKAIEFLSFN